MSARALHPPRGRRSTVLALSAALLFASCAGGAVDAQEAKGEDGGGFTCADFDVLEDSGRPTNAIEITGVPAGFGSAPAFEMTDAETSDTLLVPIEGVAGEPGGFFIVPLLPASPVAGGSVELQIMDGEGQHCDPVDFTIDALPEAPGAFNNTVEKLDELNEATREVVGEPEEGEEPEDHEQVFTVADDWLEGDDNPNSLEKVTDGEAEISDDLTEESQKILDGVVEESGLNDQLDDTIDEILELKDPPEEDPPPEVPDDPDTELEIHDPPPEDPPEIDPPTVDPPSKPKVCQRIAGDLSAQALSGLMNGRGKLESIRETTDIFVDAASMTNTLVGVLSLVPTGGLPNPVTAATGVIGVSLSTYDLLADATTHLLPSELVELDFDYENELYLEDDPDLGGYWENVTVTAQGKEWNLDGRILEIVLKRATGGLSKEFVSKHGADKFAEAAGKYLTETFSSGAAGAIAAHSDGFIRIPPCEFGPVDISDPEYHEGFFIPPNRPATVVDDLTFEVITTGKAGLVVRAVAEKFGGDSVMKVQPVEAAPIEIDIDPAQADGDPGFTAVFTVTVENANDPGVDVSIEPASGHGVQVTETGSNTYEVSVNTSNRREDFPALLRVESTSDTGLRAKDDAPPRYATAIIGSEGDIVLDPWAACVEPGETAQFEAEVYGFDNKEIIWDATGGSVNSQGQYTAPNNPGDYEVRAAAAADKDRSAAARVTVQENCQCFAAYEMPDRGIYDTGQNGMLMFDFGGAEDGPIERITFDLAEHDEFQVRFGDDNLITAGDESHPGPKVGDEGRYLVVINNSEDAGLPRLLNGMYGQHMGGNKWSFLYDLDAGPTSDIPVEQVDPDVFATVDKFEQIDDETIDLELSASGQVFSWEGEEKYVREPIRVLLQGEFQLSDKIDDELSFLKGSLFEPWSCKP